MILLLHALESFTRSKNKFKVTISSSVVFFAKEDSKVNKFLTSLKASFLKRLLLNQEY